MDIIVITPTYNERQNVAKLIPILAEEFAKIPNHKMNILFVDDSSPDGTADEIKKWQKKYSWVHLLSRSKKQGLGAAYAAGMQHAMTKLNADAFIEFDGDMQHDPNDIKKLVKELDRGYDYVIASRYVKGGSIPQEWGFDRKFLSIIGNLVARVLLILPTIRDVTGGFKLTRVKGYGEHLNLDHLISKQFAYKIQLLHETIQLGAKTKEVPIHFHPREEGESKLIKNEMYETLRVIFTLQSRNPKIRQFVKFGITGFIGYILQAITLGILSYTDTPEFLIWAGSAEIAIINNFTLNNMWTFKSKRIKGIMPLINKFFHFNLSSAGAIIIQALLGNILVYYFGEYRQLYLPLIIGFVVVPYNYIIYTKLIWKQK